MIVQAGAFLAVVLCLQMAVGQGQDANMIRSCTIALHLLAEFQLSY